MPTVLLKTGEIIEVPLEELEDYLSKNQDKIQSQRVQRRGISREKAVRKDNTAA
jgi:hypothetical protein